MRGTRGHGKIAKNAVRIIPAYAGNTGYPIVPEHKHWDHPRVCGEHVHCGSVFFAAWGSSPRMRGTLVDCLIARRRRGIIPAYAGNTRGVRPQRQHVRDHPRVCGEHCIVGGVQNVGEGSSPRMRGTHDEMVFRYALRGIIPAYAGNTSQATNSTIGRRDHPRVCGEHRIRAP